MGSGRPRSYTDEAVLNAVEQLLDEGRRDLAEGGIRPESLADQLDVPHGTAKTYIHSLVEAGDLVRVDGAHPEDYHPRKSYLPADHPDAQSLEY